MTRHQLETMLRTWQQRLNLTHWEIKIDWSTPCNETAYATTNRMNSYDRATIRVDAEWAKWEPVFAARIIAHELFHLVTRDLDHIIADIKDCVLPEVYRLVEKRYEHEIEGIVDRLAVIAVGLA